MNKLKIVSRNSELAMWQANFVKEELHKYYPSISVEIIGITTKGDKILDRSLDKIGGKGLFIKELENCLLDKTADIAVHSLKDLPAKLNNIFDIAAILKREDATDAFVSNKFTSLNDMPEGSIVGTSSPRRIAIIKQYYPSLEVKLLRGNLQTRLNKLDAREYDAIILASAGLKRLNLESRIKQKLNLTQFIPAIGQGALAIEILSNRTDLIDFLKPLRDESTTLAVTVERMVGEKLQASCSVPIAVYVEVGVEELNLNSAIWDLDDNKCCQSKVQINKSKYKDAVDSCVNELLQQGARQILDKYK